MRAPKGKGKCPQRQGQGKQANPAAPPRSPRPNGKAPPELPPPRPRPQPAGRPSCRGLRPSRRAGRHRMGPPHCGPRARPPPHPDPLRRDRSLDDSRGNRPLRLFRDAAGCDLRECHPEPLAHREPEPYVRDVTLAEDASRIRINPGIMARLRSYVLNIARANGAENIARALWIAAIDPTVSLSYKGVQ